MTMEFWGGAMLTDGSKMKCGTQNLGFFMDSLIIGKSYKLFTFRSTLILPIVIHQNRMKTHEEQFYNDFRKLSFMHKIISPKVYLIFFKSIKIILQRIYLILFPTVGIHLVYRCHF